MVRWASTRSHSPEQISLDSSRVEFTTVLGVMHTSAAPPTPSSTPQENTSVWLAAEKEQLRRPSWMVGGGEHVAAQTGRTRSARTAPTKRAVSRAMVKGTTGLWPYVHLLCSGPPQTGRGRNYPRQGDMTGEPSSEHRSDLVSSFMKPIEAQVSRSDFHTMPNPACRAL
ncbi:hypothetical protein VTK73DRAFT_5525 [Phialemonium thermophilum]|uniref:Uncharacterized protein n=1 Tax=Phialemonium thermophilum TaxID=223376 RepID=A0ABR3V2E7_9PEZI